MNGNCQRKQEKRIPQGTEWHSTAFRGPGAGELEPHQIYFRPRRLKGALQNVWGYWEYWWWWTMNSTEKNLRISRLWESRSYGTIHLLNFMGCGQEGGVTMVLMDSSQFEGSCEPGEWGMMDVMGSVFTTDNELFIQNKMPWNNSFNLNSLRCSTQNQVTYHTIE